MTFKKKKKIKKLNQRAFDCTGLYPSAKRSPGLFGGMVEGGPLNVFESSQGSCDSLGIQSWRCLGVAPEPTKNKADRLCASPHLVARTLEILATLTSPGKPRPKARSLPAVLAGS